MSNLNPKNNLDSKDPDPSTSLSSAINPKNQQEDEKSEDQLILPKEGFCPPKLDSDAFISNNQINSGEPTQQNSESHAEKFNGPLEKPKTANKAFGGITDFLLFFENRNHEIKEFAKKFQEMEDLMKKDFSLSLKILNEEIRPTVFRSFKNMPVEFKNHNSPSKTVNENKETEQPKQNLKMALSKFFQKKKTQKEQKTRDEYAQLFEKDFKSIEEFFKQTLHAYTIPGFLYLRMNEYLRTENWMKLDDLLVYTYSLFKAYLWGPTGLTDANSFAFLQSKSENGKLTLYRRADFDQVSLDFYQLEKIKEFSWSGVTSTSLIESATRPFAGKKPDKKPVLILIEVEFQDLQPENFNALYLAKISRCPGEEEVALAPGSIFELLDINKDKPEVEMRLKLITNAKALAQQGKFLHGMLQGVMRNKDELILVCLKEKELSRAIAHCKGNQLVAKFGFALCHFNEWSVKVLLDVLPTMKNLTSLTFNSVIFEERCLDQIMKCLGDLKIKQLEMISSLGNMNDIKSFIECIKYFGSLESLRLSFAEDIKINGILIRELYNETMQYLDSECIFELNMINDCDIVVKGLKRSNFKENFGKVLDKKWPSQSRPSEEKIEDSYFPKPRDEDGPAEIIDAEQKEIKSSKEKSENKNEEQKSGQDETSPKQIAKSLQQENVLSLIGKKEPLEYILVDNLPKRTLLEALEDKYIFSQPSVEAKDPTSSGKQPLETLNLNFERCKNLHDKDLKSLGCEGIQFLQSLTTLNLNFNECSTITDRALEILSNNVIQKLTRVENLHLSFERCQEITDDGFKRLACDYLQDHQSLVGLNLCFRGCLERTNEGLKSLGREWFAEKKTSLKSLHLSFEGSRNVHVTDERLENLFPNDSFESLTRLDLNFKDCKITNKGIKALTQNGLQKFKKSLKVLSLSFDKSFGFTDDGLETLSCEGICYIESLTSLSLTFVSVWGSTITDKGIIRLFQGIQHLSSLKMLYLRFDRCQVTDEGLKSLDLPNGLKTLHLSFSGNRGITDDGLQIVSQKISQLKSLDHLHIDFRSCGKITDNGVGLLCSQGIKSQRKLNVLHLRFGVFLIGSFFQKSCNTITDQSLKSLGSEGIKHLPELEILHLDLEGCIKITAKGLKDLCSDGIQYLKKLTGLHLSFSRCEAITDGGLEILSREGIFPIQHSLKALYLDFNKCSELSDTGLKSLLNDGIQYLKQLTTFHLKFARNKKITIGQLLQLQYQINLVNLPQLQLPLEVPWESSDLEIYSSRSQFSNSPNTAFVLCKDRSEFPSMFDVIESQEGENLNLKFEEGSGITDLDISNSLVLSAQIKTFKNMKTLQLNFDGCVMVTDFTLHKLCSQGLQHLESLTSFHLSLNGCCRITDTGLESLGSLGIKHLKLLVSLSLSFNGCQLITNKGLKRLCANGLKHLDSLKEMHLSFQFCEKITDKGLKRLYLEGLKSLTSFFIDFLGTKITERLKGQLSQSSSSSFILMGKNSLNNKLSDTSRFQRQKIGVSHGLSKINPIEEDSIEIVENEMFTSYFKRNCYMFHTHSVGDLCEVTSELDRKNLDSNIIENIDDILKSVKKDIVALRLLSSITELEDKVQKFINEQNGQEIPYLESLTSLNLILGQWAQYITDSALNTLCSSIFQHLKSLTNLSLNFNQCDQITNMGFMKLGSQGIRYLTSLTTLHLTFDQQVQITDLELKTLSSEVVQCLKSLTTLHLSFEACQRITDEGLQNLWIDGIVRYLKLLKTLELSFEDCSGITGVGFNNPSNVRDNLLPSLTKLRLNFDGCKYFKDEGVESLCIGVIQWLRGLTTLDLTFDRNEKITDSGLEYLSLQGIRHLESLKNLHLSFDRCRLITDKGVHNLNLSTSKLLTSLYLNFDQCEHLSDQSLKNLTFHFRSLEILHLSLRRCSSAVTDQALKDLGIQYLTSLNALYFCFDGCKNITDEGIKALCSHGIHSLKLLKTLHLSFGWCENITEEGLKNLYNNGIKHLGSLENLHICFLACEKILSVQLSSFQAQINLPQLQRPLEIFDKVIFSESYLPHQRFLGSPIPFQEYFMRLQIIEYIDDKTSISDFGLEYKDNFYPQSKLNTNRRVAMLQKFQQNKIVDGTRFEDNFHASVIGISPNCYYCTDEMKNSRDLGLLQIAIHNSENLQNFRIDMRSFCCEVLQRLKSLKILRITFETANLITDDELNTLGFEGISNLFYLTQLHLCFNGCKKLTDEGLRGLSSSGIQNLKQLDVLSLNFNGCNKITDRGLTSLCSDGIQYLKLLKMLHLSFDGCNKITDEVLKSVSLIGILNLSSIQDLQLSFLDCPKISNLSYQAFLKILEYFGYKKVDQNLKDFENLEKITLFNTNFEGLNDIKATLCPIIEHPYFQDELRLIVDFAITSLGLNGPKILIILGESFDKESRVKFTAPLDCLEKFDL